jgi:hypothetical protein
MYRLNWKTEDKLAKKWFPDNGRYWMLDFGRYWMGKRRLVVIDGD